MKHTEDTQHTYVEVRPKRAFFDEETVTVAKHSVVSGFGHTIGVALATGLLLVLQTLVSGRGSSPSSSQTEV